MSFWGIYLVAYGLPSKGDGDLATVLKGLAVTVIFVAGGLYLDRLANVNLKSRARDYGVSAFVVLIISAILAPVFHGAKAAATNTTCISNLKQLGLAQILYAEDNHDRLPPATVWQEATKSYVPPDLTCRLATTKYSYGMNRTCSMLDISTAETISCALLFEQDSDTPNPSGGKEEVACRHDPERTYVCTLDGSAKRLRLPDVVWDPKKQ